MSSSYPYSSSIGSGLLAMESRTLADPHRNIRDHNYLSKLSNNKFLHSYLSESVSPSMEWSPAELKLVRDIKKVLPGQEDTLYTNCAPLLRLLNYISRQVFQNLGHNDMDAIVFRAGDKCRVTSPYTNQHWSPDIVVTREPASILDCIDCKQKTILPSLANANHSQTPKITRPSSLGVLWSRLARQKSQPVVNIK
jgi:hypothetical protein